MKIFNVEISGLESSINACRYPMKTEFRPMKQEIAEEALDRAKILASKGGNGHDQFLTGIVVNFDVTATLKWWIEAERYRFLSFIGSSSTIHRITKFKPFANNCNPYVSMEVIRFMEKKIEEYEALKNLPDDNLSASLLIGRKKELKKKYLEILYNCPTGFELTARLTTNYRCLSNIYKQRKNHLLPEWNVKYDDSFCSWIKSLPYSYELITHE